MVRATDNPMDPYDPKCERWAEQIPEIMSLARSKAMRPEMFVVAEEGTYNPENGHFLCTSCYIREGMPTEPRNPETGRGWVCP